MQITLKFLVCITQFLQIKLVIFFRNKNNTPVIATLYDVLWLTENIKLWESSHVIIFNVV